VRLRVLFLDHAPVLSGAELYLLDVAPQYAGRGKVLLFADGPLRKGLERAGIAVEVLPAPRAVSGVKREGGWKQDLRAMPGALRLAWKVARISREYDVLYANSQKAMIVGALAGKIAKKPVIWHLHDILTEDHFSWAHRRLAVAVGNLLAARIVVNSRATYEALVKSGGDAERVRVVYCGIDLSPYAAVTSAQIEAIRQQLRLNGFPVVGVFSRLAPWKGQHVLLEALTRLPGVRALLVGGALFGEHAYADSLRKRAAELGIATRVHFLGFREDVSKLMLVSDVVVHTSVEPEPFGRVIVEGMLAGKPVVACRSGGAAELVEDGISGVLVPPGEAEALADVLADLLASPSKRRALATAGYKAASDRFSLQAMLQTVDDQIREVASAHRHRAAGRFSGR
jgi:glycosyltransferase involved in cell wall biosynthesis